MNIIKAKNNSFAAGQDINITISNITVSVHGGELDLKDLANDIEINTGIGRNSVLEIITNGNFSEKLLQSLIFKETLTNEHSKNKYLDFATSLDKSIDVANNLSDLAKKVYFYLEKKDFQGVYQTLEAMLEYKNLPAQYRKFLAYEYFQSGYIYFANSGNKSGITSFYDSIKKKFFDILEPKLVCVLAEMKQEVATREIEITKLIEEKEFLIEFEKKCFKDSDAKEHCNILLALCLRRIGERGDISQLDESIDAHKKILQEGSKKPIELINNCAIAYVRRFELTGDSADLDKAYDLLVKINEPENSISLSEYYAYPKTRNALGNIFKQKVLLYGDGEFYAKAYEAYTQAEKFWKESNSPYEWAMIQKNKAETTLFFSQKANVSQNSIKSAIASVKASLKYRTEDQAPYQHAKSHEILASLQQLSN